MNSLTRLSAAAEPAVGFTPEELAALYDDAPVSYADHAFNAASQDIDETSGGWMYLEQQGASYVVFQRHLDNGTGCETQPEELGVFDDPWDAASFAYHLQKAA
jgi:hypothetical protein